MRILSLKYKNLLSYGDDFTEIDLTDKDNLKVLIRGENGDGKSSIIEAIYLGLFGRMISKADTSNIINKFTKANLQINIKVENNDNIYEIVRYKRTSSSKLESEIYINNELSEITDKQLVELFIERDVIGMTRAEVDELVLVSIDLISNKLDIRTFFSNLHNFHKIDDVANEYAREKKTIDRKLTASINMISNLNKELSILEELDKKQHDKIDKDILEYESKNEEFKLQRDAKVLSKECISDKLKKNISKIKKLTKHYNVSNSEDMKIHASIGLLESSRESINISKCKHCRQEVSDEHKDVELEKNTKAVEKLNNKLKESKAKVIKDKVLKLSKENETFKSGILLYDQGINTIDVKIDNNNDQIAKLKKELDDDLSERIAKTKDAISIKTKDSEELKERKHIVDICNNEIFDEYGFKYEYLLGKIDDMNDIFDKYLNRFDIDNTDIFIGEDFKLQIYRLGEVLPFDQLSNGERAIVSAMFLLYQLSNQKHIGLKIFDETLDESLSISNVNILIEIINEMYSDDTLMYITHKIADTQLFDKVFEVSKNDSIFSILEER